jgi:hypothetical protein
MVPEQLKRDIQPVKRAHAMLSAVISGMGMASGHRVKLSTAVRQYMQPADVGRDPIGLREREENGLPAS